MENVKFESSLANVYINIINKHYDKGSYAISIEDLANAFGVATYHLDVDKSKYLWEPAALVKRVVPEFKLNILGIKDEDGVVVFGYRLRWDGKEAED